MEFAIPPSYPYQFSIGIPLLNIFTLPLPSRNPAGQSSFMKRRSSSGRLRNSGPIRAALQSRWISWAELRTALCPFTSKDLVVKRKWISETKKYPVLGILSQKRKKLRGRDALVELIQVKIKPWPPCPKEKEPCPPFPWIPFVPDEELAWSCLETKFDRNPVLSCLRFCIALSF